MYSIRGFFLVLPFLCLSWGLTLNWDNPSYCLESCGRDPDNVHRCAPTCFPENCTGTPFICNAGEPPRKCLMLSTVTPDGVGCVGQSPKDTFQAHTWLPTQTMQIGVSFLGHVVHKFILFWGQQILIV